jgi:hypothetical protein
MADNIFGLLRDGQQYFWLAPGQSGTDVIIFKIFSQNLAKMLAFFAQTTASFCKNVIVTLVSEKNVIFFVENLQKSQKIMIITSIPGLKKLGYFASLDGTVLLKSFSSCRRRS